MQRLKRGIKLDDDRYLPEEFQVDLGVVNTGSSEIETIEPQETAPEETAPEEGGGVKSN